jgi:hypothetical protein
MSNEIREKKLYFQIQTPEVKYKPLKFKAPRSSALLTLHIWQEQSNMGSGRGKFTKA